MTKKESLNELLQVRDNLIKVYIEYNSIIPEHIEKMEITKCIQKLSHVIRNI